jgi:hypothetical protein
MKKTGRWVRDTAQHDEVVVTEDGQLIVTIQAATPAPPTRKFSEGELLVGFKSLLESGKLRGGTDSTITVAHPFCRTIG